MSRAINARLNGFFFLPEPVAGCDCPEVGAEIVDMSGYQSVYVPAVRYPAVAN